jgi:hypothetical protein
MFIFLRHSSFCDTRGLQFLKNNVSKHIISTFLPLSFHCCKNGTQKCCWSSLNKVNHSFNQVYHLQRSLQWSSSFRASQALVYFLGENSQFSSAVFKYANCSLSIANGVIHKTITFAVRWKYIRESSS